MPERTAASHRSAEVAAPREAAATVDELRVERGRLDDVFREMTTHAPGGGRMAATLTPCDRRSGASSAAYFATPLAYVFIVIFLVLAGVLAFFVGGFFERGQADLEPFFIFHPWLYLFLIPAIAMRLWAEERRSGTIELLMTMPIHHRAAVVGKFLAAWVFAGIALLLTFPIWITVNCLGSRTTA